MLNNRESAALPATYVAPSVVCCMVLVESGYSSTYQRVEIENLGETKDEGDW